MVVYKYNIGSKIICKQGKGIVVGRHADFLKNKYYIVEVDKNSVILTESDFLRFKKR